MIKHSCSFLQERISLERLSTKLTLSNLVRSDFLDLLRHTLVPSFCDDRRRALRECDFRWESVRISDFDAQQFLTAWQADLVKEVAPGKYRAAKGATFEQFFWTCQKQGSQKPFTLWHEPVFTMGALGRLYFQHGWPRDLLGTQSKDGAFDLVVYQNDGHNEYIAGEVKKTSGELNKMLSYMIRFGAHPEVPMPASGKARNAFKKVIALRERQPPIFWAVGPNGDSRVFLVKYIDKLVKLLPVGDEMLHFSRADLRQLDSF